MARESDAALVGATRIAVGLSAIIKISPYSNAIMTQLKYISGGSCEVVNVPVALTGSSAAGWGAGFLMPSNDASMFVPINGPATFYLAASGSTSIIGMLTSYSSGASIL